MKTKYHTKATVLLLTTLSISYHSAAKVLFHADFEDPSISTYGWQESGNIPTVDTSDIKACNGHGVMKAYVNRDNRMLSPVRYRTELTRNLDAWPNKSATIPLFSTEIISFAIFVPDSNKLDDGVSRGDIVLQFHGGTDDSPDGKMIGPGYRNPQFVLKIERDKYYAEFNGDDATFNTLQLNKVYDSHKYVQVGDVTKGRWSNIQIQYNVDYRPNGNGFVKIWLDGGLKVDYKGQFGYADSHGPYVKFGVYKPVWNGPRLYDTNVNERTFYFDDFMLGDAAETQTSTALSCSGEQTVATPPPIAVPPFMSVE